MRLRELLAWDEDDWIRAILVFGSLWGLFWWAGYWMHVYPRLGWP